MDIPLSEAIRLGAMYGPQLYGAELSSDGGSCALGAALLAIGAKATACTNFDPSLSARPGSQPTPFSVIVPWDMSGKHFCPVCFWQIERSLRQLIPHLNDYHRWTRELIADWVETIERQQATPESSGEPETALLTA